MPEKPRHASDYSSDQVELVRATCLYVATRIRDLMDEVVVVGGLVPSLLINSAELPKTYRQKAFEAGYQLRLFGPEAAVETSYEYSFAFDPDNYPTSLHYSGGFQFEKHYYKGLVGELNKEELECAKAIEMCPRVKRWVRSVKGMFGLPTSTDTFYPDFVAELDDGRIMVVEYKGEHLIEFEQEKKNIGELWESKSGGKALFLWAVKKDEAGRDVYRQVEDKIAK